MFLAVFSRFKKSESAGLRCFTQLPKRGFPYLSRRDVHYSQEADVVPGVLNQSQVGNHILYLRPLVKPDPRHYPVGDSRNS